MNDKTASKLVTEMLTKELKTADEEIEFIAVGAAELLKDDRFNMTTFDMYGELNKPMEAAKESWMAIFSMVLTAQPTAVDVVASAGYQLGRTISVIDVTHERKFWSIALSSVAAPDDQSGIRMTCVYSDERTAEAMSDRGWAIEALWQATMNNKMEEFRKMVNILSGKPLRTGPDSGRVH